MNKIFRLVLILGALGSTQSRAAQEHAALSPPLVAELAKHRGVFVVPAHAADHKRPRETWFIYQDGAIYITSPASDPRVVSIQNGSPEATIAIGKPDGLSLKASGTIVKDSQVSKSILDNLRSKYPEFWKEYGGLLQQKVNEGVSVVIKYTPADS